MSWFQGTINEAVQLVNAKGCIFTVFIRDDTEPSNQLDKLLTDTKVQDILQQHVSIKLALDSENARMFGQFYPIQRVPMVYFIKQGVIKDFAIETTTVDEIIDKMDQLGQYDSPSSSVPVSFTSAEPLPTDNGSDVNTSDTTTAQNLDSSAPLTSPSFEGTAADLDKKAKLKQQMEQARARRDEFEKENEKQREIKRRQDGKEAQSTQQQIQDQQNKIHFAKIKKEKQADEAHRRKIKEQIARDREEKVAERQRRLQETTTEPIPSLQRKDTRQHDVCHLNVRQGNGVNMRNTFNAQDTLADVRTWIDTHRTDGDQPYKLLAQFPTRHFSTGDEQKTVEALDLVPSGTLIMKPIRNVASAYPSSDDAASYSGMMADYIYSAGGMVYTTLTGVVTGLGSMLGAVGSPGDGANGHRLGGPQASGSRQINGINTLRQQDQAEDDDRKKTYNGNSVNQE